MNNRDEIVLKKIIQYADEIGITIERLNLTQDILSQKMPFLCVFFRLAN